MAISHDVANAEKLRQQYRQRDGLGEISRSPVVERVDLAPPAPILPPSQALPKIKQTNAIVGFVTWFVNLERRRRGLPDVDSHGLIFPGTEPATVKVFGDLLAAMQQRRHERVGQLWLLLRHQDAQGSGRLTYGEIREGQQYTSWVNLRRVIRQGVAAGYFWRDGDKLAYASEARVCAMLGISRVRGFAVAIPVSQLRASDIVDLRALFLDAYHSGRGDGFSNPIARGGWRNEVGVKRATGRSRPSQRRYERRRDIAVASNYEDLGQYSADDLDDALRRGLAAFVVKMRGGARIVRRLSNSYDGTLPTAKRGRRWLNRRIGNLVGGLRLRFHRPCDTSTVRRYYTSQQDAIQDAEGVDDVTRYCWLRWASSRRRGALWAAL